MNLLRAPASSGDSHRDAPTDRSKSSFRLGFSISPFWRSQDEIEDISDMAKAASEAGLCAFVIGDKSGTDPGVRSNSAVATGLLPELAGVALIGCLYLAREHQINTLLASARTLADLVARAGSTPIIGLMHGRTPGARSAASPSMLGAVTALRSEEAMEGCELWIAAERGNALKRAALLADVWLANAHYDSEGLREQLRVFAGGSVRCAVRRDFICDVDSSRAQEQRGELLGSGYRGARFNESSLIAGSPAECIDRLSEVAALGFDDILVRPAVGGRAAVDQCHLLFEQWRNDVSGRA